MIENDKEVRLDSVAMLLREPMLYLSLFFKSHRQTYYDLHREGQAAA